MAAINISASRNLDGKLQGSYIEVAEGVNFIGTVAHGNTLTITDSLARFGTRTNVKPLFVNFGNSKSGSVLGRITTEHLNSTLTLDASIKNGGLSSSYKLSIKNDGNSGVFGQPIISPDPSRPLIQYIERRNSFDYADPTIQNQGYYFSSFNFQNTRTYSITIDGTTYSHTNDNSPSTINNGSSVATILAAQINADGVCKCTAVSNDGTFTLKLTKKVVDQYFTVTTNENLYQNFNNKCSRSYAHDNSGNNDVIQITRSSDYSMAYMENTTGSIATPSYNYSPVENEWTCEELVLKNSSLAGVSDGFYLHYRNGEVLNPTNSMVTYDAGEQPLGRSYLNQFSNGEYGYWRANLDMHVGYQCWDDEYNGVYLANSATISAGVKLVRQPQTAWATNIAQIQLVHSHVVLSGAHVHLRTALNTYIYLGQLT